MSHPAEGDADRLLLSSEASAPAIRLRGATKRFGRGSAALDGVDLDVGTGQVFGYLGANGAGKTTTIRLLLGLSRPSSGSVRVLGLDARHDRGAIHRRVGYLPGELRLPTRPTARAYLRFLADLRGTDALSEVTALARRLDLDLDRRLGTMSRGSRQKVGLVQALMHRPDLLVLDEPTTGLDPLVHREALLLLRDVVREGRTVFLSSHVMAEVEAVADAVAVLAGGRLRVVGTVSALKQHAVRRLDLTFVGPAPVDDLRHVADVSRVDAAGRAAHVVYRGSAAELLRAAAPYGVERITSHEPDLEEVFLSYVTQDASHVTSSGAAP